MGHEAIEGDAVMLHKAVHRHNVRIDLTVVGREIRRSAVPCRRFSKSLCYAVPVASEGKQKTDRMTLKGRRNAFDLRAIVKRLCDRENVISCTSARLH